MIDTLIINAHPDPVSRRRLLHFVTLTFALGTF